MPSRFIMSLDSIVTDYEPYAPVLFFFYPNHIRDAILSIVCNYNTRGQFCSGGLDFATAPLIQICSDLDQYVNREYSTNSLPREISTIVESLMTHVFDDLLRELEQLMTMHFGQTEFHIPRCMFLPKSNDLLMEVVFN